MADAFLSNRLDVLPQALSNGDFKFVMHADDIASHVDRVANAIDEYCVSHHTATSSMEVPSVLLVAVLNGAFIFAADLMRKLRVSSKIVFCKAESYGDSQQQDQHVKIDFMFSPSSIKPSDVVIIVDELLDNGETMATVQQQFATAFGRPALSCALFTKGKPSAEKLVKLDFGGVKVPNVWLVGYGLDDARTKRGWPHLYAVVKVAGVPPSEDDAIYFAAE
jgi:hypoxanthine phosphoribosyltransferase